MVLPFAGFKHDAASGTDGRMNRRKMGGTVRAQESPHQCCKISIRIIKPLRPAFFKRIVSLIFAGVEKRSTGQAFCRQQRLFKGVHHPKDRLAGFHFRIGIDSVFFRNEFFHESNSTIIREEYTVATRSASRDSRDAGRRRP